jgi:hypothetical protein
VTAVQKFEAADPDYAGKLEKFIHDMPIAQFLGLRFIRLEPGLVEMEMPFRRELSFVEGTLQAGPIGTTSPPAARQVPCCRPAGPRRRSISPSS